jgi:murein DD-endopeptidase MepM/ murein hydrolase activator NlpD
MFMIRFFILLLLATSLFASKVENFRWHDGEAYSMFLDRLNLPVSPLLNNLDDDDKKLVEEVRAGVNCQILRGKNNELEQILIPLTDELQIHIYKDKDSYSFETIPIVYETKTEAFTLKTQYNPSIDIMHETGSRNLVGMFISAFQKSIDFTAIQKGNEIAMIYEQKYRLGKPFSMPTLKAAMVQIHHKKHYIYLNDDDRYYDEDGKQVENFLLAAPVKHARISSRFTLRRWHPILHKYRAHLGVDYAARPGTPIYAAASGVVIFCGRTRGYGNLTKIRHADGYVTLYAHQKKFRRGIRRGKRVRRNQVIGYVGTTGLSTGPHLHFGLYKNGRAINPLRVVQITTKKLNKKQKAAFMKLKKNYDQSLSLHIANNTKYIKEPEIEPCCYFYNHIQTKPDKHS